MERIEDWPTIMTKSTGHLEDEAQRCREALYKLIGELDPSAKAITMALIRVLNEHLLVFSRMKTESAMESLVKAAGGDMVRLLEAPVAAMQAALIQIPILAGWLKMN